VGLAGRHLLAGTIYRSVRHWYGVEVI
jgi:hypothetical protein